MCSVYFEWPRTDFINRPQKYHSGYSSLFPTVVTPLLFRILWRALIFLSIQPCRAFARNRYQLPNAPRIRRVDVLPEPNLCDTSNFQGGGCPHTIHFGNRRPTFVPSSFDPHQDRSSALFDVSQNILVICNQLIARTGECKTGRAHRT